jgi:hypothetical protein
MLKTPIRRAVRLELGDAGDALANLSGVALGDESLWVVGDETSHVTRLRRLGSLGREQLRFGEASTFALADLLALPGAASDEADLEGLAVADGHLWLVGSHGWKRKNPKPGNDAADNARRLAKLSLDGNRRLLACIPIVHGTDGQPGLVTAAPDGRRALRLQGEAESNQLTDLLSKDAHFGPFMGIPGKDNGFDIEGLAVHGRRLLLGLRGPVLRGWSALLEVQVEARSGSLRLVALDDGATLLRKHFLQLDGLGVRDLHFLADDLYILAGPTMALDGDIRLYRWAGARTYLQTNRQPAGFPTGLAAVATLPHGRGTDRAEAICSVPAAMAGSNPGWLVLYDAPAADRVEAGGVVYGDLIGATQEDSSGPGRETAAPP